MWGHHKKISSANQERPHHTLDLLFLDLGFPASKLRNKSHCVRLPIYYSSPNWLLKSSVIYKNKTNIISYEVIRVWHNLVTKLPPHNTNIYILYISKYINIEARGNTTGLFNRYREKAFTESKAGHQAPDTCSFADSTSHICNKPLWYSPSAWVIPKICMPSAYAHSGAYGWCGNQHPCRFKIWMVGADLASHLGPWYWLRFTVYIDRGKGSR